MALIELYLAIAGIFGSTLAIILKYWDSSQKLETRTNKIIDEKQNIISQNYKEIIEEIIKRFQTNRTLTYNQEMKLEELSYLRYRLRHLPTEISKIADKFTNSIIYGVGSAFFMVVFAHSSELGLEPTILFWFTLFLFAIMMFCIYNYIFNGLMKITDLRKFEKTVNMIDRSKILEELSEPLDEY